jgi:hypothetical protein
MAIAIQKEELQRIKYKLEQYLQENWPKIKRARPRTITNPDRDRAKF